MSGPHAGRSRPRRSEARSSTRRPVRRVGRRTPWPGAAGAGAATPTSSRARRRRRPSPTISHRQAGRRGGPYSAADAGAVVGAAAVSASSVSACSFSSSSLASRSASRPAGGSGARTSRPSPIATTAHPTAGSRRRPPTAPYSRGGTGPRSPADPTPTGLRPSRCSSCCCSCSSSPPAVRRPLCAVPCRPRSRAGTTRPAGPLPTTRPYARRPTGGNGGGDCRVPVRPLASERRSRDRPRGAPRVSSAFAAPALASP